MLENMDQHQPLHKLAMLTYVRKIMAANNNPDISTILKSTQILHLVHEVLCFDHTADDLVPYMKLEAVWITLNLCYGEENEIKQILGLVPLVQTTNFS